MSSFCLIALYGVLGREILAIYSMEDIIQEKLG